MNRGKVIAVCTSEKKGTQKTEVPSIRLVPGTVLRAMPTPATGTGR